MFKRKKEYDFNDNIFKNDKKIKNSNENDDSNLYEFKDFEILQKHITLFNRKIQNRISQKKINNIELEPPKKKFENNILTNNLEFDEKIIKSDNFGKINNITLKN